MALKMLIFKVLKRVQEEKKRFSFTLRSGCTERHRSNNEIINTFRMTQAAHSEAAAGVAPGTNTRVIKHKPTFLCIQNRVLGFS